MNKDKKNILTLLTLLIFLILILSHSLEVRQNIINATEIWLLNVFPSLFPMFVLSELLITYKFPELLAELFKKPFLKIFKTNSYGVFVIFMSFLAGTPSSAIIIKKLYLEDKISLEEANHLIKFTFFSNPIFLINMLSLMFNNKRLIFSIIIIHYLTNLIIALILRPKTSPLNFKIKPKEETISFGNTLAKALSNAIDTLLLILGTICFYFMITTFFQTSNEILNSIIKGFLELTHGLNSLIKITSSETIKALLAICFISFGGLSIHTQIKCILSDTKISYISFLKGRIYHVLISVVLLYILIATGITIVP